MTHKQFAFNAGLCFVGFLVVSWLYQKIGMSNAPSWLDLMSWMCIWTLSQEINELRKE